MKLTPFEQQIYNCHLKHFRNGGPWKPRKDFQDLDNSTILYLNRLSSFFNKFKHINLDEFFGASKQLHPDEPTPSLKFFITRAAIKNYSLAQKQKLNQSPEKQIDSIKSSFEFITKFCLENKIPLNSYTKAKIDDSLIWLEHYRTNLINPYCLMELLDFSKLHFHTQDAVWNPNLTDNFFAFRNRYHLSSTVKELVKKGTKKIQDFIDQMLKS